MTTVDPDDSTAPDDAVEALLYEALEGPESVWASAVDALCDSHPEHAVSLRRRYARLASLGLAGDGVMTFDATDPRDATEQPSRFGAGEVFGPFQLLERLGSGGMGVVYLAEQPALHRRVALKLIHATQLLEPRARKRFKREVEAASRVEHPGICTVYEAGDVEGTPYIAMRLVEGESLEQRIARARDSREASGSSNERTPWRETAEILRIVEKVARALHAAHECGLIHRDVKPGNVVIDANGEPVILDFGLAHVEDSDVGSLTLSGATLGTPAYMAPELVASDSAGVDRRADVYSLGVTLYELLTLRRPFDAPTREALFHSILEDGPPDPTRLRSGLGRELPIVLETALAKDPERRYGSAAEFADDLRRLLDREPIHARRAGPALRVKRWMQRNRFGTALLVSLTVGLVATLALLRRVGREEARASSALRGARVALLAAASARELERDPTLSLLLAREALALEETPATRTRVVAALANQHERAQLAFEDWVGSVSASPTGEAIAVGTFLHGAFLVREDGERIGLGAPDAKVHLVRYSPDGSRILVALGNAAPSLFHSTGTPVATLSNTGGVYVTAAYKGARAATFSPDGKFVCIGGIGGVVSLYSVDGEFLHGTPPPSPTRVACTAVAPDSASFAFGTLDGRVVWSGTSGEPLGSWNVPAAPTSVEFSPDGAFLVVADTEGGLRSFSLSDGSVAQLDGHVDTIYAVAISPDGRTLATASFDKTIRLWSRSGNAWEATRAHIRYASSVNDVVFSPDGALLAGASNDGTASVHDLDGREIARLAGHGDRVTAVAFLADAVDGLALVTGSVDRTVRRWSLGVPGFPEYFDHERTVVDARYSPDGSTLLTLDVGGRAVLREADGTLTECELPRSGRRVAWSPSGERFALGSRKGLVSIRDRSGRELASRSVSEWEIAALAFLDDDHVLAGDVSSATPLVVLELGEGTLEIRRELDDTTLRGASGGLVLEPDGRSIVEFCLGGVVRMSLDGDVLDALPLERVTAGALAPSGEAACVGLDSGELVLLDVAGGLRVRARLPGHGAGVYAVDYSPDGRWIATGAKDGDARLWSADGEALLTYPHAGSVWAVDFAPDGARLVTASAAETVRVWPVLVDGLAELARERSIRGFTEKERAAYAELLGLGPEGR